MSPLHKVGVLAQRSRNFLFLNLFLFIAYGFIDEEFQTIDFNESEAKDYFKEFKSSLDYYNTHIDEFESSGPRGEVARSYLEKFDIVLRMFKGTKTQADFALKMLHVFIIYSIHIFKNNLWNIKK